MKPLHDWQPDQYLRFKDERTQPTIDLARRIEKTAPARVMDVGCGPGNSTAILESLWPRAEIIGLDSSESMLDKARKASASVAWIKHDAAQDMSFLGTFDVIFSNAAFQWIPGLADLLARLYGMLRPEGVLAAQIPYVRELPVYAAIQSLVSLPEWREFYIEPVVYPLHHPYSFYYDALCTLGGNLSLWQTEYIHIMESHDAIVEWYKGSGLRPFLNKLPDETLRRRFLLAYREIIESSYPIERDGKVLLPFNRVFFLISKS